MRPLLLSLLGGSSVLAGCGFSPLTSSQEPPLGDSSADATAVVPGAFVTSQGATFGLWAPHAAAVSVVGDFNGWAPTLMAPDGLGDFSVQIPHAKSGDHYHYVLSTPDAGTLLRQDPRAFQVATVAGDSILYDQTAYAWAASFTAPPAREQVVYELHLATFNDPTGTGSGSWNTAAQKLPYLQALGINMIEVMPVAEFPGTYSWGYNPDFPFAPETQYGTPDDMKAFGIGVILDVVHNHWGGSDLPMWCFDGPCFGTGNGGIYFYTDALRDTGFGPRPDYGRSQIRDYIADNETTWLGDFRLDGLRWDSVVNIRRAAGAALPDGWALLQRLTDTAHSRFPAAISIAEDLQDDAQITDSTADGGTGFDSQWDPAFFYPLRAAMIATSDASREMTQVAAAVSHGFNGTASHRVVYTEDHDMVAPKNGPDKGRMPALISPASPGDYYAQKRSTLGATLALTSPGIPMLFMGQEFLEDTPFPFSAGPAIDWSNETTYAGILRMYHRLIALRRNMEGDTAGLTGDHTDVFHVNDNAKVIAYRRWNQGGPGDDVIVVANFSSKPFPVYDIGFPASGTWHVRYNGDSTSYMADFRNTPSNDVTTVPTARDGFLQSGAVGVGPYSAVILSQ
jgi:1,4-alpha-glucan branching enzyme